MRTDDVLASRALGEVIGWSRACTEDRPLLLPPHQRRFGALLRLSRSVCTVRVATDRESVIAPMAASWLRGMLL